MYGQGPPGMVSRPPFQQNVIHNASYPGAPPPGQSFPPLQPQQQQPMYGPPPPGVMPPVNQGGMMQMPPPLVSYPTTAAGPMLYGVQMAMPATQQQAQAQISGFAQIPHASMPAPPAMAPPSPPPPPASPPPPLPPPPESPVPSFAENRASGLEASVSPAPPKPRDENMARNIEILCQFVSKNGPWFEEMARAKEAKNPKFAFLFGGEPGSDAAVGAEYFKWMKAKCIAERAIQQQEAKQVLQSTTEMSNQAPLTDSGFKGLSVEDVSPAGSPKEILKSSESKPLLTSSTEPMQTSVKLLVEDLSPVHSSLQHLQQTYDGNDEDVSPHRDEQQDLPNSLSADEKEMRGSLALTSSISGSNDQKDLPDVAGGNSFPYLRRHRDDPDDCNVRLALDSLTPERPSSNETELEEDNKVSDSFQNDKINEQQMLPVSKENSDSGTASGRSFCQQADNCSSEEQALAHEQRALDDTKTKSSNDVLVTENDNTGTNASVNAMENLNFGNKNPINALENRASRGYVIEENVKCVEDSLKVRHEDFGATAGGFNETSVKAEHDKPSFTEDAKVDAHPTVTESEVSSYEHKIEVPRTSCDSLVHGEDHPSRIVPDLEADRREMHLSDFPVAEELETGKSEVHIVPVGNVLSTGTHTPQNEFAPVSTAPLQRDSGQAEELGVSTNTVPLASGQSNEIGGATNSKSPHPAYFGQTGPGSSVPLPNYSHGNQLGIQVTALPPAAFPGAGQTIGLGQMSAGPPTYQSQAYQFGVPMSSIPPPPPLYVTQSHESAGPINPGPFFADSRGAPPANLGQAVAAPADCGQATTASASFGEASAAANIMQVNDFEDIRKRKATVPIECRYYKRRSGCFNGANCRFLHHEVPSNTFGEGSFGVTGLAHTGIAQHHAPSFHATNYAPEGGFPNMLASSFSGHNVEGNHSAESNQLLKKSLPSGLDLMPEQGISAVSMNEKSGISSKARGSNSALHTKTTEEAANVQSFATMENLSSTFKPDAGQTREGTVDDSQNSSLLHQQPRKFELQESVKTKADSAEEVHHKQTRDFESRSPQLEEFRAQHSIRPDSLIPEAGHTDGSIAEESNPSLHLPHPRNSELQSLRLPDFRPPHDSVIPTLTEDKSSTLRLIEKYGQQPLLERHSPERSGPSSSKKYLSEEMLSRYQNLPGSEATSSVPLAKTTLPGEDIRNRSLFSDTPVFSEGFRSHVFSTEDLRAQSHPASDFQNRSLGGGSLFIPRPISGDDRLSKPVSGEGLSSKPLPVEGLPSNSTIGEKFPSWLLATESHQGRELTSGLPPSSLFRDEKIGSFSSHLLSRPDFSRVDTQFSSFSRDGLNAESYLRQGRKDDVHSLALPRPPQLHHDGYFSSSLLRDNLPRELPSYLKSTDISSRDSLLSRSYMRDDPLSSSLSGDIASFRQHDMLRNPLSSSHSMLSGTSLLPQLHSRNLVDSANLGYASGYPLSSLSSSYLLNRSIESQSALGSSALSRDIDLSARLLANRNLDILLRSSNHMEGPSDTLQARRLLSQLPPVSPSSVRASNVNPYPPGVGESLAGFSANQSGREMPSDQYDPLFDSIEPIPLRQNKSLRNIFPPIKERDDDMNVVAESNVPSLERSSPNNAAKFRKANASVPMDVEENNRRRGDGATSALKVVEFDNDAEVVVDGEAGVVENESPGLEEGKHWSPGNAHGGAGLVEEVEIDQVHESNQSKKNKDSKAMKLFRLALTEFVKDVLKPSWREGHMSKEAFKTIVKKAVDKVSNAMQNREIPKTRAKIDQYVASSERKLTKLVQGYVDKYIRV